LLDRVAPGVTTCTVPLIAAVGTVAVISVGEVNVNRAGVPLKETAVAPLRSIPNIVMDLPGLAARGTALTNGAKPTDNLNIRPSRR
jgi:hypothetical protein